MATVDEILELSDTFEQPAQPAEPTNDIDSILERAETAPAAEPVATPSDPAAIDDIFSRAETPIAPQPSPAIQQFPAQLGFDQGDPTKLSRVGRPPRVEPVPEVTPEAIGEQPESKRTAGVITKDIGGSFLAGASSVPANLGTTIQSIGETDQGFVKFLDKHPVIAGAVPGAGVVEKLIGKKRGKALEFIGKAAADFWEKETKSRRKRFISEKGRKSTHPAWIISSGLAETTPQLIADYVTGNAFGRLAKDSTSLITSAVEGNTAGASSKRQVSESIMQMSEEQLRSLPSFNDALERAGGDIEKARVIAAKTASNKAYAITFLTATLTSLALDKVGGGTLDKWMQDPKIAKIGMKKIFAMAGMEATEEAIQSGFETIIQNRATGVPIFEGVLEAMGYGAATGAILGGTLTGARGALQRAEGAQDVVAEGQEEVAQEQELAPPPTVEAQEAEAGEPVVSPPEPLITDGEIGVNEKTPQSGTDFGKASEQNESELRRIVKEGKKKVSTVLKRLLVDADAGVKDTLLKAGAKDAEMLKTLTKGASASAQMQFKQGRSNIKKVLGKTSEKLMADFIDATRTVEASNVQEGRDKVLRSRQGITAETAQDWLNEFETKHSPQDVANVKAASEEYFKVMRSQLDESLAEGLISPESHAFLTEHHKHYSPRLFVEALDDSIVGGKRGDLDSGLKALDEGSEKAMITDPSIMMAHVISRTQSRVFKNRANKALGSFVESNPENDFGRIIESSTEAKSNEDIVTAFNNGQKQLIAMPKGLAEQWNGTPAAMSNDVAQILQWGSGTKVLKALATGANPEFMISNLPRDIFFAWFNSGQYSRALPKALGQIATDYKGTIKDAIFRKGEYENYIKEGGGMDYLATQGKVVGKPWDKRGAATGVVGTTFDVLAYLGETSEIATRLAVRKRAMQNGLSPTEATHAARNMLDFAQGGKVTKAMDNMIPYLNAAVQGTRGSLRTFKTDPAGASIKASQLMAMGYALSYAFRALNKDAWESISDREKATKWVIPLGISKKDANGNKRHMYIAIAKDQFQQVFSAMGQSLADGQAGKPWSGQMINSVSSLMPVEFANINSPIVNSAMAYFQNYDTWTNEKVWRGYQDISPSNERNLTTPAMATGLSDIAKKMGVEISPERLTTATSKLIPTSNPLASGLSDVVNMSLSDKENKTVVEALRKIPGARRIIRFSRPSNPTDRQAKDAKGFDISTEGKTQAELRGDIQKAKRDRNDIRQGNNVRADDFMSNENATGGELRVWLHGNIDGLSERKRLWMRERGKHPDRVSGAFRTGRKNRTTKRGKR